MIFASGNGLSRGVTHLIDEAALADRVMVLHEGRLVFEDSAKALAAGHSGNNMNDAFVQLTELP